MRPRIRAAGAAAVVLLSVLATVSAAGAPLAGNQIERPYAPLSPQSVAATAGATTGQPTGKAVPAKQAPPPDGSLGASSGIRELKSTGSAITLDRTGAVQSVTAPPGKTLGGSADGFVQRFAGAFGLTSAHSLAKKGTSTLPGGDSVTHYEQRAGNVPVLGGDVVVTTDKTGAVRGAVADTSRLAPVAIEAKLTAAQARAIGMEAFLKRYGVSTETAVVGDATLWLLDPRVIGASGASQLRPTYWVRIADSDGGHFGSALVDGLDGTVKLLANERKQAKARIVCDGNNVRVDLNQRVNYMCLTEAPLGRQATTRVEGGGASTVADVNTAYTNLGAAYDYFKTYFGVDSFNGKGAQILATVRACHIAFPCPYDNAFWDGTQFVFGQGYAVDDVAAHEYAHAVTEHASNLFYWFQSGAINEALSDIFGQFIDLETPADDTGALRWRMGEGAPGGAIRDLANPELYWQPSTVGGTYWTYDMYADNGGVHTNSGPANRAAAMIYDGDATYGIPALGKTKSAQLWYRTMHLLPSGANYQELGVTLMTACRQLIGNYGFTDADCVNSVQKAVLVTYMYGYAGQPTFQEYAAPICDALYQTPQDLFYDDFENGSGNWATSNAGYWFTLPSATATYSYAASGHGAMNGWTLGTGPGHNEHIEMRQAIPLPTGKPVYAHFDFSMINDYPGSVDVYITTGSGWQPLNLPGDGRFIGNRQAFMTAGYGAARIDLAAYAGRSVRLLFKVNSPTGYVDWYLDNFRLYTCDPHKSGVPTDTYGYFDGNDMVVSFDRTYIAQPPGGGSQSYSYEFSYEPAIPGAPTSFTPSDNNAPWSITVSGADPTRTYSVAVRIRTADGQYGPPATIRVAPRPVPVCLDSGSTGSVAPPPLRRPAPTDGSTCGQVIPRR